MSLTLREQFAKERFLYLLSTWEQSPKLATRKTLAQQAVGEADALVAALSIAPEGQISCPQCGGSGVLAGLKPCRYCRSTGKVVVMP